MVGQTNAGKLPAGRGREKITVARANVGGRSHHRTAAQHHLVAHELAVVLAEGAGERVEARIRKISADGALPELPIDLPNSPRFKRVLLHSSPPNGNLLPL